METTREAYQQKMEAQLKEWGARIDTLKARAEKATADARSELHKKIDALGDLESRARKQLEKVRGASKEAWQDVKGGLEDAWNQIATAAETLWRKVS